MAALAQKKRSRSGHRGSLTKTINDAEADLTTDPPDQTVLAALEMSIREKLTVLDNLDTEIWDKLDTDDAVAEDIQQSDTIKRTAHTVLVRIKQLNSSVAPAHRPAAASTSSVKLPKLMICPFRGDPTKWTTFWDSFQTTVDKNPSLSGVEKFSYLKSFIQGPALEAISGFSLSNANYDKAVEVLQKRFGDRQLIISRHMDTLMKLEAVISDRHLRDLRRLYDSTETHIRSLHSLGISSDTYGSLLSPVLLTKLPPDMRLIISREVGDSNLDMDKLLKSFNQELSARERANPLAGLSSKTNPEKRSPPTNAVLMANNRISDAGTRCAFCQQDHISSNCTTVVTTDARRHALKTSGRCFNCLRRGHVSRTCRSSSRCQKCRARHHTSICDADKTGPRPPSLADSNLSPTAPPFKPDHTTTTICSSDTQAILLQTARVSIHNPNLPDTPLEVRLLLDGGSQKSYLSERARDLLNLKSYGEQSLSIATFGSLRRTKKVCPIVNVCLTLKGYPKMSLSLYVVPTICEPLTEQPIADCIQAYPHLLGLDLADSPSPTNGLPVDLLVGADYYWKIVTGNVCRGEGGPTAIHTKLGWVLSGPSSQGNSENSLVNLSVTHVLHIGTDPSTDYALDNQLSTFWDLESFGVAENKGSVLEEFEERIRFTGERYEVSLPWKTSNAPLSPNYTLCEDRLKGLLRRLKQNPEVMREYDSTIQGQLQQGIVELAKAPNENDNSKRVVHYLPHHAVIRKDKDTTKIRIVYDASAKSEGPSLNQCLHTGPKFHQRIADLLLRFRVYPVAVVADIEKAFLMIQVAEEDRDVLRFLWVKDLTTEPPEIIELRFARVIFGVSSSPFLLNATIKYHLEHTQAQ